MHYFCDLWIENLVQGSMIVYFSLAFTLLGEGSYILQEMLLMCTAQHIDLGVFVCTLQDLMYPLNYSMSPVS